jgi:hypothetical protein
MEQRVHRHHNKSSDFDARGIQSTSRLYKTPSVGFTALFTPPGRIFGRFNPAHIFITQPYLFIHFNIILHSSPRSYPMSTGLISSGINRPGREADSPPSAEIKNALSYTSTPPYACIARTWHQGHFNHRSFSSLSDCFLSEDKNKNIEESY